MKKLFPLIVGLHVLASLHAVQTQSFIHGSYEDFIKGEFENVSLSHLGLLQLAPALVEVADLDEPIVWTAVADREGNLYLGTGNEGKVLKADPQGKVTVVFSPEEVLSRALAVDEAGNLYAGTSPAGRVYRIRPGGRPEIYFDPEDNYIWDMTFDAEGNLYVSTGSRARIYRLPKDYNGEDEVKVWFESEQTHLTALAWDGGGNLLAGTTPEGILYRITGEDEAFTLFNSGTQEIKQISVLRDGRIYFATFSAKGGGNNGGSKVPASAATNKSGEEEATYVVTGNPATSGFKVSSSSSGNGGSGMIYTVDAEGFVEAHWGLPKSNIFTFFQRETGEILAGTNDKGRLYSIKTRGEWSLLQQAPLGGEISVILPDPANAGAQIVITSNPAKVYRLTAELAGEGAYRSDLFDATQIARWGNLAVMSEGAGLPRASFRTRSGNTEKPGDTWSDWQDVIEDDGNLRAAGPNARFLQYEFRFPGEEASGKPSAGIRQVRQFFQTRNVAPFVASVKIVPMGFELLNTTANVPSVDLNKLLDEKDWNNLMEGRAARQQLKPMGEEGLVTVAWKAYDSNGDDLEYTVSLKGEGESQWITLAEKLVDPVLTFNSKGFAEGYYRIKVRVSDAPSNDAGRDQSGEQVSEPFLIDNSPPVIAVEQKRISGNVLDLTFTADDAHSILLAAYYTLDGKPAKSLRTVDGLFDSARERFNLRLEGLEKGAHSLVLEAHDEQGKAGVLTFPFQVE